jgi:predicted O-methyltransferase YrrM
LIQTREDTPRQGLPAINVKPEEGRFLQFLVNIIGTRRAVEIGTLGGYSGTWIARGLLPGGKLTTIEREPLHAEVARRHFENAGVSDSIEIRIGDAHQELQKLSAEGPFDFVFIDAEKDGYLKYYEWAVTNLKHRGVLAAHNALRHGDVVNPSNQEPITQILRQVNQRAAADSRVISTIYPGGDGMLVAVKTV